MAGRGIECYARWYGAIDFDRRELFTIHLGKAVGSLKAVAHSRVPGNANTHCKHTINQGMHTLSGTIDMGLEVNV